jgi:flagellar basal-body rod protein FlgG
MSSTGNPLDLAISGGGFFQLRAGEEIVYSRQGQFRLGPDGTVVTPQGYALQQAGGGDLVLERAAVTILTDGTVLDQDRPVGRIGVFGAAAGQAPQPVSGSIFKIADDAVEEIAAPELRQGMVEASNVTLGDEMVEMMAVLRQAEGGSRLVQLYDDLMGRAITTFGQGGK